MKTQIRVTAGTREKLNRLKERFERLSMSQLVSAFAEGFELLTPEQQLRCLLGSGPTDKRNERRRAS